MRKECLKNKDYVKLLLAVLISAFGDVLFDLFIVWKITVDSQSIMNAAYMLGSSIVFRGILSLGIGIIIDKYSKKNLIVYSNIISAIIIAIFAVSYRFVIEHIIIGISFILLNDVCNTIFFNTYMVIASEKFEKEKFITFQATSAMCTRCINILGAAIVGVMINYIPDIYIFIIDVISFLVSAMIVGKVDYKYIKRNNGNLKKFSGELFKHEIREAYQYILKNPIVRGIVIIIFGLNLAYGFIPNILPLMLSGKIGNSMLLGTIKAMIALGEILGLAIVNRYGKYVSRLFKIAMFFCSICMLSLIIVDSWFLSVIFFFYGMFDAITQPMFSYMVTNIDMEHRGKVLGGIDAFLLLSPGLGIAIGTKLIETNYCLGFVYLAIIFLCGLLGIMLNKDLNDIRV